MPVPIAVMIVRISSFERIRSMRAFCTLRILPRSGRMAWKLRSRPRFAELGLGLPLELRVLHLHVEDAGQTLADVVPREGELLLLEEAVLLGPLVDGARQRGLEAGEVGATLVGIDVVDERERVLVVALVVLDRPLHLDTLARCLEHDRFRMERLAVAEQPLHELGEPTLVEEGLRSLLALALVLQRDRQALVEEGELPQAIGDGGVVEARFAEDRMVGLERHHGARALRLADDLQLLRRLA